MSDAAIRLLRETARAQEQMANCAPALDDILLFALERRYLGIGQFRDVVLEQQSALENESLIDRLRSRVRLIQVDEICFDRKERFHLPGVESVLSSMRDCGHSLVFLVSGEPHRTRVLVGLSQFVDEPDVPLEAAIEGYRAAWSGHFPGTRLTSVTDEERKDISYLIGRSTQCGVLTGIPSLKRQEETAVFVQGLERLIRVLRGRSYTWLSVADPIALSQIDDAIDASRRLQSDIHHFVRTNLSKGVSSGKTVMMGMFGLMGQGETDGNSFSESTGESTTKSEGFSQQRLEGYQRAAKAAPYAGAAIGAIVGTIIPGPGTAIGAAVGGLGGTILSPVINGLGGAITGDAGHAITHGNSITNTRAFTNTASHAIARQLAGGGFGSFGLSWTRTTTVGQELLNRKAEYCEDLLGKHEERLQQGSALGMWNLGHYFCAEDAESFSLGQAVLRSLFAGMDSHFEPPRVIRMPKDFTTVLRRFANLYVSFPNDNLRTLFDAPIPEKALVVANHPLGFWFNGVGTPVNTRELAISTPLARQDVEGITVTERASFGVNLEEDSSASSITVGTVQDRGALTRQKYHLLLDRLPKHLGVFGLTGSGKTNTVCNLLEQLWKVHRIPFMVIEPTKAEYRALATSEALSDDLVVISAGVERTAACPLRLNPFQFDAGPDNDTGRVHVLTHIDRLKATFNASFPMYASMPYILEEAILEVYRERGWDLGHSCNRFVDIYAEDFSDYVPTLRDLYHKIDVIVRRKGYWVEQQMNIEAALKARLSSLMVGSKGHMFNCARSLPSASLFGKPVVVELKHMGDDDEKAFLMGLLIARLYEYREATAGQQSAGQALQHVLVVEEAHRLLKNTGEVAEGLDTANVKAKAVTSFADMLAEIRAFGQGVVVVDQVPSRLNTNVIKGTAAKIVHRLLADDDRRMVGNCMGLDEDQIADLALLETGQCVVHQDGQRKAFLCGVQLNQSHETAAGPGAGLGPAVAAYKKTHSSILDPAGVSCRAPGIAASDVDAEDYDFCSALHKAMIAGVFSDAPGTVSALRSVVPTRHAVRELPWPEESRGPWLWQYWGQITDEIWAFYGGEYRDFLHFRAKGGLLLDAWACGTDLESAHRAYAEAAKEYAGIPRLGSPYTTRNPVANAYDQLLTRAEAIVGLRERFRSKQSEAGQQTMLDELGRAILRGIHDLIPPPPFSPAEDLILGLVQAIVMRLRLPTVTEEALTETVLRQPTQGGHNA